MVKRPEKINDLSSLENVALRLTNWVGSITSLILHSVFFVACFVLVFFGVPMEEILLVLTTVVSLEAIYLAIFIQMTVNRNTESLEEVEEDIEEIQGDIDEIQEDVDEIQEEVVEDEEELSKMAANDPQVTIARLQAALDELGAQLQKSKRA